MDEKRCNDCGVVKGFSEFYKAQTKLGIRKECKSCSKARGKIWRSLNPEKTKANQEKFKANNPTKARDYYLKSNYGIDSIEYELLLSAQNGVCFLCKKPCSQNRRLSVDHDHETGAVRGLLCYLCNKIKLGSLTLSEVILLKEYLENPPADLTFGGTRYVPEGKEKPKKRRKRRAVSRRRVN